MEIPTPRKPLETQLEDVQAAIEGINSQILLLQMQRERYEQIGHRLVGLMMEQP